MDAFELLKETRRMCEAQTSCASCGLHGNCFFTHRPRYISDAMMGDYCSEVEKWSKAHQPIANAQKFEEVFGLPTHCMIDQNAQWWDEPYEEPKHEAMR